MPGDSERLRYQQNLAQDMRKVNGFTMGKHVSRDYENSGQNTELHEELSVDTKHNSNGTMSNHYEVPNLSSMLYEFTNKEADRVNHCFRIGNFYSLRDLPKHIFPGNVSQMT